VLKNRSGKCFTTFGRVAKIKKIAPYEQLDQMRFRGARCQGLTSQQKSDIELTPKASVRRAGGVVVLTVAMVLTMFTGSTPALGGTSLPACPIIAKSAVKPISANVVLALKKYYAARHLTPISVYKNEETVLNVKQQSIGVHWCRNLDGSKSGYVGVVPKNATAAVMVHVKHRPYPETMAASTFATLARMPLKGWKVVSDDTGP